MAGVRKGRGKELGAGKTERVGGGRSYKVNNNPYLFLLQLTSPLTALTGTLNDM